MDVELRICRTRIGMFLARRPNARMSQEMGRSCLLVTWAYINGATGDRRGGAEPRPPCTHEKSGMLKQGHGGTSKRPTARK